MLTFSALAGRLAAFFVVGLTAFGCAAPTDEERTADGTDATSDDLKLGGLLGPGGLGFGIGGGGAGQVVIQPSGLYSTIVNAKGSGCPKGSWKAGISPDGQTFTVTFSAYEARVSPGQAFDTKECTLDVSLVGTSNLTFAVGSFYYQGYALLENGGQSAVQEANYSFGAAGIIGGLIGLGGGGASNLPIPGELRSQNAVAGPIDQSFTYADNVGFGKWSPCSKINNLHIRTDIALHNDPAASGSAYINDSTVDGTLSFAWKLNWKKC